MFSQSAGFTPGCTISLSPGLQSRNFGRRSYFNYTGGKPYFFSYPELMEASKTSTNRRSGTNKVVSTSAGTTVMSLSPRQRLIQHHHDQFEDDNVDIEELYKFSDAKDICRFYCFEIEELESVSTEEQSRVRQYVLYVYVDDDTMCLNEPKIPNSGMPQGVIMKRTKVPKPGSTDSFLTLNDIHLGGRIPIFGKMLTVASCDAHTKSVYANKKMYLGLPVEIPKDGYMAKRKFAPVFGPSLSKLAEEEQLEKTNKFLAYDGKILRFYAVWKDDHPIWGKDPRKFNVMFFLADDTVQITEIFDQNAGRDAVNVFLSRQKLPKSQQGANVSVLTDDKVDYYSPADFAVGKVIEVYSRNFLIYGADEYTKKFYKINFGISDWPDIDPKGLMHMPKVQELTPRWKSQLPPPPRMFGSEEDSMASCMRVNPQKPKIFDRKAFITYGQTQLKFRVKLNEGENSRELVLSFWPVDGTLAIYEIHTAGSVLPSQFLNRGRVTKPGVGAGYITIKDLKIGNVLTIYSRKFEIVGSDQATKAFLQRENMDTAATAMDLSPRLEDDNNNNNNNNTSYIPGDEAALQVEAVSPRSKRQNELPNSRTSVPLLPLSDKDQGGLVWGDVVDVNKVSLERAPSQFFAQQTSARSAIKGSRRTAANNSSSFIPNPLRSQTQ